MMYPNPNYLKFFPETEVPDEMDRSRRSCCLKIGAYAVIKVTIQYPSISKEKSYECTKEIYVESKCEKQQQKNEKTSNHMAEKRYRAFISEKYFDRTPGYVKIDKHALAVNLQTLL